MEWAGTSVQLQSYCSSHQFQDSPFHLTALWCPQRLASLFCWRMAWQIKALPTCAWHSCECEENQLHKAIF